MTADLDALLAQLPEETRLRVLADLRETVEDEIEQVQYRAMWALCQLVPKPAPKRWKLVEA